MMNIAQETQPENFQEQSAGAAPRSYPPRDGSWMRKPAYPEDPRIKSPALAIFLSLVPGLGQVYVGYYRQGFINILVIGSLISALTAGPERLGGLMPLLIFFLVFYWLYNLVDAARRASFINQALAGIAMTDFPQEFRMPEKHGSLPAGLLMILVGLIVSSNTLFGYSLEWLRRWWPLGLVVVGAYLIYESLADRRGERKAS